MTSVQRFFPNARNLVREAVLSASSVRTSAALRTLSVARQGNGRVRLVGDYTGHESSTYDVEIAAGGTTLRASTPVLAGVGNGTLTVPSVGAPAVVETWTLTLVDLGTDTTHAQIQIESIVLRAKTAGAAGNLVRVNVTPDLERTATDYSLLADWPAGQSTLTGPEFDFGGLPLSAKGELDADSSRLQFGTDHTVYRPYRTYKDGAWQYGLTPAPAKAIAAGTRAWTVTGGYDVTVTNGTTTETYADIETFYDLLAALASSALVEVVGVVTADRQPGGMAMRDIPLRTSSWVLSATGIELDGIAPAATAPTEIITIQCTNDDTVGDEIWSVTGTVSGPLGQAVTGAEFVSSAIGFTVPEIDAGIGGTSAYGTRYEPVARGSGETVPAVCVHDVTLGSNARPMTVTFTYTQRGLEAGLDCNNATMDGRIDLALLGLEGGDLMALDSEHASRLQALYSWRSTFMAGQTTTVNGIRSVAKADMDLCDEVASVFTDAIAEVYASATARAEWDSAFTAAQSDMSTLAGTLGRTINQHEPENALWITGNVVYNSINGHAYLVNSILDGATQRSQVAQVLNINLADPAIYKTDGSTYTAGVTVSSVAYTINLTDLGVLADIHFGRITGNDDDDVDAGPVQPADLVRQLRRKYAARMDYVLALAGIPPKSDASSRDGDGSWRDTGASAWWVDKSGKYFPVFSNTAYITASQSCGSGASAGIPAGQPYSTRELGFWIAVDGEEHLKEGDTVTITIASVDGQRPYSVGAKAEIQIVTAGPAYLAGGVDGDDTQTWSVTGSASGAHPDYEVPTDGSSVPAYTDDGVTLQLAAGGIPFALGDRWTYDIEAGQFRWRQGSDAWSSLTDIDAEVALADGVYAQFQAGAAPSFVGDDAYRFLAEQPAAPSHLQRPTDAVWAWDGDSATLTAELPDGDITAIAIARHHLPAGASVTVEIGDGTDWDTAANLDASRSVALAMLDGDWSVTDLVLLDDDDAILTDEDGYEISFEGAGVAHIRLTVEDATGGDIGWLWIGDPLYTSHHATTCRLVRQWATQRGAGINPARQYLGRGMGGEIAWDGAGDSLFTEADRAAILAMLDDLQANAEPLILLPHHLHPAEAALVDIQFDQIEMRDVHEWQPNNSEHRDISLSIPLAAVIEGLQMPAPPPVFVPL